MALTTFYELKTSIANFLNRDDLTAIIPDFITLAEVNMDRQVRHFRMEKRSTATVSSQYLTLPTDLLEPIRFMMTGGSKTTRLELMGQGQIAQSREETADRSGQPTNYAITDGSIELFPRPDGDYTIELVYYAQIDKLNAGNTSNWVLEYHPDLYLYGALIHSAPYLEDDQRMGTWAALYQSALDAIIGQFENAAYSGASRRIKITR